MNDITSKPVLIFSVYKRALDEYVNESIHRATFTEMVAMDIPAKEILMSVAGYRSKAILIEDSEFARETLDDLMSDGTYLRSTPDRTTYLVAPDAGTETEVGILTRISQEEALTKLNYVLDPISGQYWRAVADEVTAETNYNV